MDRSIYHKTWNAVRTLITRNIRFPYENIPIRIEGTSYRKILNWILVELSIVLKREKSWGWPTFLQIEPTTLCNLRCTYCPVSQESDRPTGQMNLEMFKRILDETGQYALLMVLWGWGEPFLNPQVYDMIAYANEKGVRVISSTNGHIFSSRDHARKLVLSGIDALIVSTTGVTQETYTSFRNGNVDASFLGVRNIVEQKRRLNVSTPLVSLTLVVTRNNEHEVDLAKEIARELGVDMLSFKKVNTCSRELGVDESGTRLPRSDKYKRFKYDADGQTPLTVKDNPCKALWQKTNFRWDGRVNSCTFDFEGVSDLGDFTSETFKEIWRGKSYQNMRAQFREDWKGIPICRQCTYAFEGGNYNDIIAESFFFEPKGASGVPETALQRKAIAKNG